jgi:hypothetical protein
MILAYHYCFNCHPEPKVRYLTLNRRFAKRDLEIPRRARNGKKASCFFLFTLRAALFLEKLNFLWHHKRLPVLAREQCVSLGIIHKFLFSSIESQLSSKPVRNIRQMGQA